MNRRHFLKLFATATALVPATAIADPVSGGFFGLFRRESFEPSVNAASQALNRVWDDTARFEYIRAEEVEWISDFSSDYE